jgi:hypothetical protein
MKKIITIALIFIITGCVKIHTPINEAKKNPDPLVTADGKIIPYERRILDPNLNISFLMPTAASGGLTSEKAWIAMSIGPVLDNPEAMTPEEPEYIFGTIMQHVETSNLQSFLNADNCDPLIGLSSDKKIDLAYRYINPQIMRDDRDVTLIEAENECNFPGGWYFMPQDLWKCGPDYTFEEKKYRDFCEIVTKMGFVDPNSHAITDLPFFYDSNEYILRVKDQIYRLRKSQRSNNKKGEAVLRQILMSAEPVAESK